MNRLLPLCLSWVLGLAGCPLPDWGGEGQPCFQTDTPGERCRAGYLCVEDTCIKPECTESTPCPPGSCCDYDTFQCIQGECISGVGDGCVFDPGGSYPLVNDHFPACDLGLTCLGYTPDGSNGVCPGGHPSECWFMLESEHPDCVDGMCTGSFCAERCGAGDVCNPGFRSVYLGEDCFCIPSIPDADCDAVDNDGCPSGKKCIPMPENKTFCIPVGNVPAGDSCDWSENQLCQAGHYCLENICHKLCEPGDSSTCPAGSDCLVFADNTEWGYCDLGGLPDGSIGDPCPAGSIHPEAPACQSGLMCVVPAPLATPCPGGSPDECWTIPPQQNPVCQSGMCAGSFCAEQCSGGCDPGFAPVEVDEECYCAPVPPSDGCDPMSGAGCGADRCLPLPYDTHYVYCVPEGDVAPGNSCDYNTGDFCTSGYICVGMCAQICDPNNSATCDGSCMPLGGDVWGICF